MWFGIIALWSMVGFLTLAVLCNLNIKLFDNCDGFEFVNPVWVYRQIRVNIFGACLVALFFGFLCPVATAGYWIYKFCTVGRR